MSNDPTHAAAPEEVNRRRAYRCAPPAAAVPCISIVHAGGRVTADGVLDVNARGARLIFAPQRLSGLRPGREVVVVVQGPGLEGCVDIPGRIVFAALRDGRIVVGTVFTELPDVAARADSAFFSLFNRRAVRRAADPGARPTVARIARGDAGLAADIELEVVNHSPGGIGFLVDGAKDRLLQQREALEITVQLPGEPAPRQRTARVCHRAERSGAVYYGCAFASAA